MNSSSDSPDPSLAAVQACLDALASTQPVPAGGAAAAIAIAFGASLGVMAARISDLAESEALLLGLQQTALRLASEDCAAFTEVLDVRRRPDRRDGELQSAWERATRAPLDVAETAAAVATELDALRGSTRASLSCDLGAARLLVVAGAQASVANARENLRTIQGSATRSSLQRRLDALGGRFAGDVES